MDLRKKSVIVTGGSRGLGLGLVEALVAQGALVTVVARDAARLSALSDRLGVTTICANVTNPEVPMRVLSEIKPSVLALNAGATPRMAPLDEQTWADFTVPWDTDVKAGLFWMQAALNLPLAPGSRVLVSSSGAAQNGSPLSGGYAGAKRMLWIMASYANGVSVEKRLGVHFQAMVPQQMIGGTGVGQEGANAYAQRMGIRSEDFLARFGAPLTPRQLGDHVVSILTDSRYESGFAFGLKGDTGITSLDGAAA